MNVIGAFKFMASFSVQRKKIEIKLKVGSRSEDEEILIPNRILISFFLKDEQFLSVRGFEAPNKKTVRQTRQKPTMLSKQQNDIV